MAPLPVEVLRGIYLGILTGIIPGLVAWAMGFTFKYFTGVSIPGFGVVVMALALAGVNGGLLALTDQNIQQSTSGPVIITAIVVVLMISLYAHAKGDAMGAAFPRRLSLKSIRERTLSADVVELVGGRGHVRVTVTGEVADMEGYPPLTSEIREGIHEGEWTFPAELTLGELETRFAERLRTEFDLSDVSVRVDERGDATVVAAPPLSGLSKRVPAGTRAVSVDTFVPTGLARGDTVRLLTPEATVEGTILSARSDVPKTLSAATDGGETEAEQEPKPAAAATTTGGDGRVTVAVPRARAEVLLEADRPRLVVTARGTRREFELISLLRRAGKRFRKVTLGADASLVGSTLADATLRETHGVAVLAVRRPDGWVMAPRGSTELAAGDQLFVAGTRTALEEFAEVVG
ncbi:potassium channel family protein [Halorarius halobius]|uniref:potassium channel family protein n=1 Tax=Halorarius halobius TaxID=2962671 RepID=UPI0020CBC04E|nr:TrkA C-terminal domain-containing protein [Halorarius halobius]